MPLYFTRIHLRMNIYIYVCICVITQTPHSFHLNPNKQSPKPKDLSKVPSPNTRGIGDKSYVGSGARPQGTLGLAPG